MRYFPRKHEKRRRVWHRRRRVHYAVGKPSPEKRGIIQWRLVLFIALASLALAASTYAITNIVKTARNYQSSQQEYASYRALLEEETSARAQRDAQYTLDENQPKLPKTTSAPVLWTPAPAATVSLDNNYRLIRLRKKNDDLIGWINIPGTRIDYPIVQAKNNDFYLEHTFAKNKSPGGAIFMDYRGNGAFQEYISVIYGHHMKDGSMFSDLRQYKSDQFLLSHQQVQIEGITRTYQFQVFAAFFSDKNDDFLYYNQSKKGIRQELLAFLRKKSGRLARQVSWPGEEQPILILTTCDYGNPQGDFWTVAAFQVN